MIKYTLYPIFFLIGYFGITLIELHKKAESSMLLLGAVLLMFFLETLRPYQVSWRQTKETLKRDIFHFLTNHSLLVLSLISISLLPLKTYSLAIWPDGWDFHLQVLFAIFILDFGITLTHYYSHKSDLLWKLHEPHHSLQGLYGFNGLMKHPIHQAIESSSGVLPLLVMGVSSDVLQAVTFCVSIQLLLQHSNVDYTVGPLRYFLAVAENHRFHHVIGPAGNVNFGLFFTIWDRFLGTCYYDEKNLTREVGLSEDYPQLYKEQLVEPFNRIKNEYTHFPK